MVVLGANNGDACSLRQWDPNDLLENEPVYSANGRFCVVERYYEGIPDFASERAGKVLGLDDVETAGEKPAVPPRTNVTVALYEIGRDRRRLISEFPIPIASLGTLLVSDSGKYVIAAKAPSGRFCWSKGSEPTDSMVTIYAADGRRAGSLAINEIVTPYDAWELAYDLHAFVNFELRHESDAREVVVVSIPISELDEPERYETRRVDVATATLIDEKREIFPSPHTYATAAAGSEELFSRAVLGVLPSFPEVMIKARIRGLVRIHVVVSDDGRVQSASMVKPLPFGADTAAIEAARQWKFQRGTTMSGDIVFHFEDVAAETYRDLMLKSPPTGV